VVERVSSLNKNLIVTILFLLIGCSPKGLILIDKENPEENSIRIAVFDFSNHSRTSNPRLGREIAERMTYRIFSYSQGRITVIERDYIQSILDNLELKFTSTFSKEELISVAESLNTDFIIKGSVVDYSTDIMDEGENIIEILASVISSKDGSTIGMVNVRKEEVYHENLVTSVSDEAGKMIVEKKQELQNILRPPPPDSSNVQ
jgi:hypothetical protein